MARAKEIARIGTAGARSEQGGNLRGLARTFSAAPTPINAQQTILHLCSGFTPLRAIPPDVPARGCRANGTRPARCLSRVRDPEIAHVKRDEREYETERDHRAGLRDKERDEISFPGSGRHRWKWRVP